MKVQIVGAGCPKCMETERLVFNACAELNLDAEISHVTNVTEFAKLGVMLTPAIVVDGKVVLSGKIPTAAELKRILIDK